MATFNGSRWADAIEGTKFDDIINGLGGDDDLIGLEGNDTIDGGTGRDRMEGGLGDDIYYVDNVGDTVIEGKNEGTDNVRATISYVLPSHVETLYLMYGAGAINGTGNDLDNTIYGNTSNNILSGAAGDDWLHGDDGKDTLNGGAGDDRLSGGAGADAMTGGTGNDTYFVDHASDGVSENANEGTDEVWAEIDYMLGANVENLSLARFGTARNGTGNALDNVITGNGYDNVLDGGAGNDTIVSGGRHGPTGADTMIGGTGNDTFHLTGLDDTVVEFANEGIDRIVVNVSYVLPANVENLAFERIRHSHLPFDVDGTGNGLDNIIDGTDGINVLSGAGGNDHLYGHEGADVLVGGSGNDHLDGGSGADVMVGGIGNDGYLVDDAGDIVTENAGEGSDFVDSWVAYVLGAHVENLDLRGTADIDGTGNDLDNFIGGNAGINVLAGGAGNDIFDGEDGDDALNGGEGNDSIDGGLGADTMAGGLGDDLYFVIDDGNTIVENLNEGIDTVETRFTHSLAANVEHLILRESGGAIDGTGNGLNNTITGNSDNNVLSGMGGGDTLLGGGGIDQLFGGNGNDTLDGGAGDDILDGGASNDTLIGGIGVDLLTGNAGIDTFQFNLPTDGADIVADFVAGTDRFALDNAGFGIAGTGTLAANGIAFVQGAAATSASATVIFNATTHQILWDADGSGAGSAQLLATLLGVNAMSASDFLIV